MIVSCSLRILESVQSAFGAFYNLNSLMSIHWTWPLSMNLSIFVNNFYNFFKGRHTLGTDPQFVGGEYSHESELQTWHTSTAEGGSTTRGDRSICCLLLWNGARETETFKWSWRWWEISGIYPLDPTFPGAVGVFHWHMLFRTQM